MGKPATAVSVRMLLLQTLAHALIFAAQNAGNLVERALLAPDLAASAALGLSGTAFCLLSAFTTNVVNVSQLVAGRRLGDGDTHGAWVVARHALILAGGGAVLGLMIAAAAAGAAAFVTGPARHAALFLAAQGVALGPHLGAAALTGYFAGTMRVGPWLLALVIALPIAVHLALTWILTGLLAWSLAGAGLARLGAALAVVVGILAIVRSEFAAIRGSVCRFDWGLLWSMLTEGGTLGLQQVVAGVMVLLLYFRASSNDVISAALSLTHSGVYPLLFAAAWGSSQAVSAAAALAVGRGNGREFMRVTWLGLVLTAGLACALPWGVYALFGRTILAWLVEGCPTGNAVLIVSVHFMDALVIFFVFDFAINYLSGLLRAANEQAYLLKVTAVVACGFGLANLTLQLPPNVTNLMGAFVTAQAVWAALLLIRVITCWPGAVRRTVPVHRVPETAAGDKEDACKEPVSRRRIHASRAADEERGSDPRRRRAKSPVKVRCRSAKRRVARAE
jgi:Na+-driven multidrug efflux pump